MGLERGGGPTGISQPPPPPPPSRLSLCWRGAHAAAIIARREARGRSLPLGHARASADRQPFVTRRCLAWGVQRRGGAMPTASPWHTCAERFGPLPWNVPGVWPGDPHSVAVFCRLLQSVGVCCRPAAPSCNAHTINAVVVATATEDVAVSMQRAAAGGTLPNARFLADWAGLGWDSSRPLRVTPAL
eukprot:353272-Chlamydomonas_euryale.AAC.1